MSWATARLVTTIICDVLQNPVFANAIPARYKAQPIYAVREPDRDVFILARSDRLDLAVIPPLPEATAVGVPNANVVSNLRIQASVTEPHVRDEQIGGGVVTCVRLVGGGAGAGSPPKYD